MRDAQIALAASETRVQDGLPVLIFLFEGRSFREKRFVHPKAARLSM